MLTHFFIWEEEWEEFTIIPCCFLALFAKSHHVGISQARDWGPSLTYWVPKEIKYLNKSISLKKQP